MEGKLPLHCDDRDDEAEDLLTKGKFSKATNNRIRLHCNDKGKSAQPSFSVC